MGYVLVFLGGGIGAALRHGVNRAALILLGPSFPFGTLFVNVVGSFPMGAVVAIFMEKGLVDQPLRLFLATGVLGGFTTFSAFGLDSILLWERGAWFSLAAYVIGSVALSIVALVLGLAAVRAIG